MNTPDEPTVNGVVLALVKSGGTSMVTEALLAPGVLEASVSLMETVLFPRDPEAVLDTFTLIDSGLYSAVGATVSWFLQVTVCPDAEQVQSVPVKLE